ncbi:MAG: repair protein SbcC/Rad50 [Actinomycetota bacterium]|nr:repair protein SbcC/Rad50 [Actinomycetota bacterium]
MRPRNLKLKGFTSFRDEQEIDFTDLDLFVLWGPTGSGKSSLLDAITYALFGYVDRVGNQISQLISHGQPRLTVTLEFAVGNDIYKVTRSTSNSGSKALLERKEGDSWESYGEGADSVREVNKIIPSLLGLDYEAFSRSVILPQGKFAEFLTGDSAKRREILTELLGLELFRRMSQRANEIAKNAKVNIETKTGLLEREYAGIDEVALKNAEKNHENAVAMAEAAKELDEKLAVIEKAWAGAESSRKALANCLGEVQQSAETFEEVASDLDAYKKTVATTKTELDKAKLAAKDAEGMLAGVRKRKTAAEKKSGSLEDLLTLRTKAIGLAEARTNLADSTASLTDAEDAAETATDAFEQVTAQIATVARDADKTSTALEAAEAAHEEAHLKERVGSIVDGLSPGDPCPVCDRPLESIPKAERKQIDAARKALDSARTASAEAAKALQQAETRRALAEQSLAAAKEHAKRSKQDVANKKGRLELLLTEVGQVAQGDDPLGHIDALIKELRTLATDETEADANLQDARAELSRRELAASRIEGEIDNLKTRMKSVPLEPLCARVQDAAPEVHLLDLLPNKLPDSPDELATIAMEMSKELSKLGDALEGVQARREKEMDELLSDANSALPEGMTVDSKKLPSVVAQIRGTAGQLKVDAAVAAKAVKDMKQKLTAKTDYEKEIDAHKQEQATYGALGKELRSDSIVQYLQAEALTALAQAATIHLQNLSSTRYRLAYEDDRFLVIDAWNGDERRNVKTLSGGETFQASLALALALSDQVQYLAVTERSRLDSLFLDEGFGTLDADTLEVVVGAIEQLGSEDRLVGVITHVPELAERFVRIEVTKSQRGSTLKRADAELVVGV